MNVKKDDLAILIKAVVPENVGRIVRAVEFSGYNFFGFAGNDWWTIEMVGAPAKGHIGLLASIGQARDCNLRPVSGLPDTDNIDTEQPIETKETA